MGVLLLSAIGMQYVQSGQSNTYAFLEVIFFRWYLPNYFNAWPGVEITIDQRQAIAQVYFKLEFELFHMQYALFQLLECYIFAIFTPSTSNEPYDR